MAEPFLAEIRMMSFGFPPKGWSLCDGQLLPINQNQALFSLLGTNYGGDGRVNFGLPDLRSRVPIHMGSAHTLGERGGEEAHTVAIGELPQHIHLATATNVNGSAAVPANTVLGAFNNGYTQASALTALNAASIASIGGNQPHVNMQPFLTLTFCIALQGIFPSQT